jgi:hypothetical protein
MAGRRVYPVGRAMTYWTIFGTLAAIWIAMSIALVVIIIKSET